MEREPESFLKGTDLPVHRYENCIEIRADCIEKRRENGHRQNTKTSTAIQTER
jgi:hypothetical protein